jgi:hypothetical protein
MESSSKVGNNMAEVGIVEYILTYAWAILIVIAVAFVLWRIGLFSV